jgi:F-type H+-transporting ATPase subunit b
VKQLTVVCIGLAIWPWCGGALLAQHPEPATEQELRQAGEGRESDAHQAGAHLTSSKPAGSGHAGHLGDPEHKVDPASIKADLAIWTFVVFLVVLGVLWRFAWGPIVAGLQKREQRIADNIAAAQRQNDEAKALLVQYEQKLANAANEVREIVAEARRDAEYTKQDILAQARAEAEAIKNRGLLEIETATSAALKELGEFGANLAVELAGRIVKARLRPEDHDELIKQTIRQFVDAKPSRN